MPIWYSNVEAIGDLSIVSFSGAGKEEPDIRDIRGGWKEKVEW